MLWALWERFETPPFPSQWPKNDRAYTSHTPTTPPTKLYAPYMTANTRSTIGRSSCFTWHPGCTRKREKPKVSGAMTDCGNYTIGSGKSCAPPSLLPSYRRR